MRDTISTDTKYRNLLYVRTVSSIKAMLQYNTVCGGITWGIGYIVYGTTTFIVYQVFFVGFRECSHVGYVFRVSYSSRYYGTMEKSC